jgi:hypothetical protein
LFGGVAMELTEGITGTALGAAGGFVALFDDVVVVSLPVPVARALSDSECVHPERTNPSAIPMIVMPGFIILGSLHFQASTVARRSFLVLARHHVRSKALHRSGTIWTGPMEFDRPRPTAAADLAG